MKRRSFLLAAGLLATLAGAAIAQTKIDDRSPLQPGDVISLGPNSYPVGATYKIASCDPVGQRFRECRVLRRAPLEDGIARPITLENYREATLLSRATPGAVTTTDGTASSATSVPRQAVGTAAQRTTTGAPVVPTIPNAGRVCPKIAYGGPIPGNRPASAALFRQKIMDSITMGSFGNGWYGVELSDFQVGSPMINRVSHQPGVGAVRTNSGAPVNAAMYPVSVTMTVCEGTPTWPGSWRTSRKKYLCFVSKDGEWTCAASS